MAEPGFLHMSATLDANLLDQQSTTRDAFLGGRVFVSQPVGGGFRAGLDSVLLAASISLRARSILDLGAGAGTAAICALADLAQAKATLLDNQGDMVDLAKSNLAINGFCRRATALCLDVTARGSELEAAGLPRDYFDVVIANPPFFASGAGTLSPRTARAWARHMPAGELDLWVKTAATCAAPGGEVIFIHLASALPQLLAGFCSRFGAVTVLPVAPRAGEAATRVLVRGKKASRAPFSLLCPLVLHAGGGSDFLAPVEAIFRGNRRLHW